MRCIVCPELGPPETLIIEDREVRPPRPDQVVVGVAAAGVNFVDALFVAGTYQIKPPVPFVPGSEIAGVVREVGGDVTGWQPGDRVLAMTGLNGWSEQVTLSPFQLIRVPDAMALEPAAAFMQSYATARFALHDRAQAQPGESLLVLGAGGGVGLATIDVAKAMGLRVLGAASSPSKRDAALAAGADAVVDSTTEDIKSRARDFAREGAPDATGVDLVLDPIGGEAAESALRALGYLGRYLVIGFAAGSIPKLPLNQVLLRNRSILGVDWGAWSMANSAANATMLEELLAMVADGRLHPSTPTTYSFDDATLALNDLLHRRITGKVVLVP